LLSFLFKRRGSSGAGRTGVSPASARVPQNALIYAIGDVHGRADLLDALLTRIDEDVRQEDLRPTVVFMGDYIDRGPNSAQVVDRVLALHTRSDLQVIALKGNHEELLLRYLNEPDLGPRWSEYGGGATLMSYGVRPPLHRSDAEGWSQAHEAFRAALPQAHLKFYKDLRLSFEAGDYVFVHAGVRSGVAMAEQTSDDMLWIRRGSLDAEDSLPRVVVHGHTPAEAVDLDGRRIGIDTGAYASGRLTALKLKGAERSLLQTGTTG
jgi:serine/threonine protein phosphatase 1